MDNPTMRPPKCGISFVTFCTYKERQDALRNTTIMDNREEESDNNVHRGTVDKLQNVSASNISKTSFSPDNELPETKVVSPQSKYEFTKKSLHPKFAQFNGKPESPQKPPDSPVPDYEPVQICPQPSKQGLGAASDTNPISSNSRIMRVTIGEYSQSPRKEPAKFDFLGQKHIRDEKHYSNVDGASLHSELQDTLSRSNLKKVSSASALDVSDYRRLEHQSHCQLQNSNHIGGISNSSKEYTNIEKLTRMLQCKQDEDVASTRSTSSALRSHVKLENTGNGILKNGSNQRSSRSSKNSEKSISFGN